MDLETVRWKLADELSSEEKNFLAENADQLNDEEKDAFKGFLTSEEPEPIVEPVIEPVVETPAPVVETPTEPAPIKTFKTQEELDAFIAEQTKAATPNEEIILKDKYENPRDFYADLKKQQEIDNAKAAAEQTAKKEAFEKEYAGLIVAHNLPKVDTAEGLQVKEQILKVGLENNKPNFTEAYNLWSKIPQEFGGGYIPKTEEVKKQESKSHRQAAAMVNNGGGDNNGKPSSARPYTETHNNDLDTLLDKALG